MTTINDLESFVDEYVNCYELDDDECHHEPTKHERFLIEDAINGLIADEQFTALVAATVAAERDELRAEVEALTDVLHRNGFRRCDVPACNCGSWHHRFGLPERMAEIKSALADAGHPLSNDNGNKPLNALSGLVSERDALRAKVERLRVKAAAFDWLKDEHDRIDPMARCVVTRTLSRGSGDWVDFANGNSFARVVLRESSIDAARAAQEGKT